MAIGRKTGGRDWEKGKPGGPGRPKLPENLRTNWRLTKTEFESIAQKYLDMDQDQLKALKADPKLRVVDAYMVSIILRGIETGEVGPFEWLMQRHVGKVKEQVEHTVVRPTIIERLDGRVLELGMEAINEDCPSLPAVDGVSEPE